jgi:hypothetical protein
VIERYMYCSVLEAIVVALDCILLAASLSAVVFREFVRKGTAPACQYVDSHSICPEKSTSARVKSASSSANLIGLGCLVGKH